MKASEVLTQVVQACEIDSMAWSHVRERAMDWVQVGQIT